MANTLQKRAKRISLVLTLAAVLFTAVDNYLYLCHGINITPVATPVIIILVVSIVLCGVLQRYFYRWLIKYSLFPSANRQKLEAAKTERTRAVVTEQAENRAETIEIDHVKEATKVIMKQNPADVEALMACKTENGETVDEALKNLILVIKENIKVRRFVRYEGVCSAYVHGGGTHGILVNFETTNDIDSKDEFTAYGKDIAMQVAAANPSYVDEASVPAEVVAKEKEIMLAQMAGDPKNANKPEAVKQKMIEGKIKKFFKENCLVDQEFVKDGDLSVAQYTAKVAKDLGGDIKIVKFTRFQKGEGLEKRADDFAAEVASMVK